MPGIRNITGHRLAFIIALGESFTSAIIRNIVLCNWADIIGKNLRVDVDELGDLFRRNLRSNTTIDASRNPSPGSDTKV